MKKHIIRLHSNKIIQGSFKNNETLHTNSKKPSKIYILIIKFEKKIFISKLLIKLVTYLTKELNIMNIITLI